MSRVLTVRVCDSSGKDLLQATELVDVPLESAFRDVLNDLPADFADRTLLEVSVREYEGAPDLSSLRLRAGSLDPPSVLASHAPAAKKCDPATRRR
jgi:hypothetical protein